MKIAFASDDAEHGTVAAVRKLLEGLGHEVLTPDAHGQNWVDVGREVGEMVAGRNARLGIVCCHTGTGVSIAANKVPRVRAALCNSPEIAEGARLFNHANVLALSLALTPPAEAEAIVQAWLSTPTGGGEHREAVERLG